MALLGRSVEDDVALAGRELVEGHVRAHAHGSADLLHEVPHQAAPGLDGALVYGEGLVGHECRAVHRARDAGAAAGRAGAAAVEGEIFRTRPVKYGSAGRAGDGLLGRDGERGRYARSAVRAHVAAAAREEQTEAVQQLGHGAEGGAHAGDARALVERESCGHVEHLVYLGAPGLREAATRIRGERLQVAPRSLGVEHAEGERALARPRDARDAHELAERHIDVDVLQVVDASAPHLNVGGVARSRACRRIAHGRSKNRTNVCMSIRQKTARNQRTSYVFWRGCSALACRNSGNSNAARDKKSRTPASRNEPTYSRWVPSSSPPASLTTKDACTRTTCVGSLNKRDGSPSCSAGVRNTFIIARRPADTSLDFAVCCGDDKQRCRFR